MKLIHLACLLLCLPAYAQTLPLELTLTGTVDGSQPYDKTSIGLKIANTSDHPVAIERGISVEKVSGFKWAPQMAIEAITSCDFYNDKHDSFDSKPDWHATVKIPANDVLAVTPWTGSSCSSQCLSECYINTPMSAGTYRFVVVTTEGQRISGPTFKLP